MRKGCRMQLGRRFGGVEVDDEQAKTFEVREARWVRPGGELSETFVVLREEFGRRSRRQASCIMMPPGIAGSVAASLREATIQVQYDKAGDGTGFVPDESSTMCGGNEGEAPAARVSPSPRPASPGGASGDGENRDAGPLRTGRA